jgi:cytochrome-b5 reductase
MNLFKHRLGLLRGRLFRSITTQKEEVWRFDRLEPTKRNKAINSLIGLTIAGVVLADGWYMYEKANAPKKNILLPDQFTTCELKDVVQVNHDTFLYKINAKTPKDVTVPYHIVLKDDSCQIGRSYTPVYIKENEVGLLIKHYPNGSISTMLKHSEIGDYLFLRGPLETMSPYHSNSVEELAMIAGGTGITPMYQLIKHVLDNPIDSTRLKLYYCNKTEEDILMKRELDILSQAYPERLQIHYAIDSPDRNWRGLRTLQLKDLKRILPNPDLNRKAAILVCGPDGFISAVAGPKGLDDSQGDLGGILAKLGYEKDQVYKL